MTIENEKQEVQVDTSRPNWLTRFINSVVALFKKGPPEPPKPVDTPTVGNGGDPGIT